MLVILLTMSEVTHGFSHLPHDLVMSSVVSSPRFAILSFLVGQGRFLDELSSA